jgi:hypothetical protein
MYVHLILLTQNSKTDPLGFIPYAMIYVRSNIFTFM